MVPAGRMAVSGGPERDAIRRSGDHVPGDHLLGAYLAATGLLAAGTASAAGLALAVAHGGAVGALWAWSRRPVAGRGRVFRFFRIFLPVALTPVLYTELETLNQLVSPGYLDGAVQGWEAAIFGGQPSITFAERLPSPWLSELLHAGYFSYYLVVPGAALAVYVKAGGRGLARLTISVALAFFVCYLCFAVFPVAGPRYEFARIGGALSEEPLFRIVHGVLEAGSSKGTAFPSSHVAAAGAALLACRRDAPRWFWVFLPAVVLLTVGTVYGRFHYAVDALAGLAVAAATFAAAPGLQRRLGGDGRRTVPSRGGTADSREPGSPPRQPSRGPGYPNGAREKGEEWTKAT